MEVIKAGSVLLDLEKEKICLIYRRKFEDYTFPKGHLEDNETIEECAIRETEEETGKRNVIIKELPVIKYSYDLIDVTLYMYISLNLGDTYKEIKDIDKEEYIWVDIDDVDSRLSYDNLIEFWNFIKKDIIKIVNNKDNYRKYLQ